MKNRSGLLDQEIVSGIDRGATFVTATRRLSRWLQAEDDSRRKASGELAWTPPEIVPWSVWLERCWFRLRDWGRFEGDMQILTERQESFLWREILDNLPVISQVLMPGDLAAEAARAWSLMQSYEIGLDSIVSEGGEDARGFAEAAVVFARRCRNENWVDRASLVSLLSGSHAEALAQILPREIVLIGFDVLTPAQQRFLDEASKYGLIVTLIDSKRQAGDIRQCPCADSRDELLTIANWARELLEKNAHTNIGVVLPDLEKRAIDLADVFDDVLAPASILPGHVHDGRVWNQSLGRPLADWPVIDAALRALRLVTAPGSLRDIGLLLRSPYFGERPEESDSRASLDVWLREQGFFEMSLDALASELAKEPVRGRPLCPTFAKCLQDALAIWRDSGGRKPPGDWSRLVVDFLLALGWPGSRTIDSSEMQITTRFHQELASMASLDTLAGSISQNQAVGIVSRIAGDTMFQPEQKTVPVQVLGLLETTGLVFDHLWIAGFSHRNCPRPIKPNSLLPAGLQRKMRLPRSCPETELVFGRQLVDRLCGAATEVTFSWNEQTEHEVLRPSPLLPTKAVLTAQAPNKTKGTAWQTLGSAQMETVIDNRLPTLPVGSPMVGGTAILKSQSACAFQAQARYRLGSSALESPHPGLDRRIGGQLVHRALEKLWRKWRDLDGLMNAEDLEKQISDALGQAIRGLRFGQRQGRDAVLQVERERLCRLIGLLLEQERTREDFQVIETEKSMPIDLPGLTLRTRSDRVDRLATGATIIVDYKSGAAKTSDWLGSRPVDPQLPIYAVGSKRPPDGLAFAILKAGQVGYRGIASDQAGIPGVSTVEKTRGLPDGVGEWSELLGFWQSSVLKLADDFTQGLADVAPRDNSVCRYCELTALCRRHDLARDQGLTDA